jgi:hypothetical protein
MLPSATQGYAAEPTDSSAERIALVQQVTTAHPSYVAVLDEALVANARRAGRGLASRAKWSAVP